MSSLTDKDAQSFEVISPPPPPEPADDTTAVPRDGNDAQGD